MLRHSQRERFATEHLQGGDELVSLQDLYLEVWKVWIMSNKGSYHKR